MGSWLAKLKGWEEVARAVSPARWSVLCGTASKMSTTRMGRAGCGTSHCPRAAI